MFFFPFAFPLYWIHANTCKAKVAYLFLVVSDRFITTHNCLHKNHLLHVAYQLYFTHLVNQHWLLYSCVFILKHGPSNSYQYDNESVPMVCAGTCYLILQNIVVVLWPFILLVLSMFSFERLHIFKLTSLNFYCLNFIPIYKPTELRI